MRFQGMRPEAHTPTFPPSCASVRDYFEILKHTAKGVGRKFPGDQWEKQDQNIASVSLSLL